MQHPAAELEAELVVGVTRHDPMERLLAAASGAETDILDRLQQNGSRQAMDSPNARYLLGHVSFIRKPDGVWKVKDALEAGIKG